MAIDFSNIGKVVFQIYYYIINMLSELSEEWVAGKAIIPAANHIFTVSEYTEKFVKVDVVPFHRNVDKLLFFLKEQCHIFNQ